MTHKIRMFGEHKYTSIQFMLMSICSNKLNSWYFAFNYMCRIDENCGLEVWFHLNNISFRLFHIHSSSLSIHLHQAGLFSYSNHVVKRDPRNRWIASALSRMISTSPSMCHLKVESSIGYFSIRIFLSVNW